MPDLDTLIILSNLYGISLDELLGCTTSSNEAHELQGSAGTTPSSSIQETLFLAFSIAIQHISKNYFVTFIKGGLSQPLSRNLKVYCVVRRRCKVFFIFPLLQTVAVTILLMKINSYGI